MTSLTFLRRAAALIVASLAAFAFATPAAAQTGKLAGRVTDATGESIIGAAVVVVGTPYAAAANVDGEYVVLRIPPGTYSVRFSSIGYQAQIVEGVRISTNQTTEINAQLAEETYQEGEVVVQADAPVVDVTQTSTLATVGREEIAVLPVQDLSDLVNLQAGVVDGHFRGGRLGEVQYQVDGVSVNNPYDNSSTLTLDRSVLEEVQVISGTFDAEYGQALSGVVNAVLRAATRPLRVLVRGLRRRLRRAGQRLHRRHPAHGRHSARGPDSLRGRHLADEPPELPGSA